MSERATGYCFDCGKPVPKEYPNKFYCGETCRIKGWKLHHPEEKEPDWNIPPIPGAVRDRIERFQNIIGKAAKLAEDSQAAGNKDFIIGSLAMEVIFAMDALSDAEEEFKRTLTIVNITVDKQRQMIQQLLAQLAVMEAKQ